MEYLDDSQVGQLLEMLLTRTANGIGSWEPAGHDFEFKTAGKSFFYFIASGDKDDLPPFVFEIWRGDPTEPFASSSAEKLQTVQTTEFSTHNEELRSLYFAAKKAGLNTEGVAAEILSDFD